MNIAPQKLSDFSGKTLVEGSDIEIWYMRRDFFREGICGNVSAIDPEHLEKTHVLLGSIACPEETDWLKICESIYWDLQGENWSHKGEANAFIRSRNLGHTSMSVGDVVRFARKNAPADTFVVKMVGFGKI